MLNVVCSMPRTDCIELKRLRKVYPLVGICWERTRRGVLRVLMSDHPWNQPTFCAGGLEYYREQQGTRTHKDYHVQFLWW